MKNIVKFALAFLLMSVVFVGCEKQDAANEDILIEDLVTSLEREEITPSELPGSITTYVEDLYFDTYIEMAFRIPRRGYELGMGSGDRLYFDLDGRVQEYRGPIRPNGPFGTDGPHGPCYRIGAGFGSPVDVEDLPDAILDYISENYPDNEAQRAKQSNEGLYVVGVNVPVILVFDSEGNFLREISPLHDCHRPCRPVRYDQLPDAITTYISENFGDAEFRRACARRGRVAIWLMGEEGRIILVFDREGNLLFQRP